MNKRRNGIAMANRWRDFRSFCGATERIRNVQQCETVWSVGVAGVASTGCHNDDAAARLDWTRIETRRRLHFADRCDGKGRMGGVSRCERGQSSRQRCYLFRICLPFLFMFGRRQFSWRRQRQRQWIWLWLWLSKGCSCSSAYLHVEAGMGVRLTTWFCAPAERKIKEMPSNRRHVVSSPLIVLARSDRRSPAK